MLIALCELVIDWQQAVRTVSCSCLQGCSQIAADLQAEQHSGRKVLSICSRDEAGGEAGYAYLSSVAAYGVSDIVHIA